MEIKRDSINFLRTEKVTKVNKETGETTIKTLTSNGLVRTTM